MLKARADCWSTNLAQISSFIEVPSSEKLPSSSASTQKLLSSVCGLGWRFEFSKGVHCEVSKSNAFEPERRGSITVMYKTHQCRGMGFRNLTITVDVQFLGCAAAKKTSALKQVFHHPAISQDWEIGTYIEPFPPGQGKAHFVITVAFDPNDGLSLPTTISSRLSEVLALSLEGQMLIDTKFYLYSGKSKGKARNPRAVYGNAGLLTDTSTYVRDCKSPPPLIMFLPVLMAIASAFRLCIPERGSLWP